jgi:hypothetical protein
MILAALNVFALPLDEAADWWVVGPWEVGRRSMPHGTRATTRLLRPNTPDGTVLEALAHV